ncbi:hypothetical protein B0T11DRAFT_339411 [Plectosphaerella cucumerina]|uniref:CENP-V/GFA domain-containing protein n=1 Tax=Plectosphaerella cucumerina TaxID=40658 RepID=A0A8K0TDM0_9PEZI|nr:hypothetical protein B0T11DRAFT_339411 [Plectosphaerella cucumerina]
MTTSIRRPYTGSCHCGSTRYILHLNLPHTRIRIPTKEENPDNRPPTDVQLFYRCNCTVCQKAGILHILTVSPPDDFLLLAPLDPEAELGDYRARDGGVHWYFCKTCGMRCFAFIGPSEVVDVDVGAAGESLRDVLSKKAGAGAGPIKAWRPKKEGWQGYLSINAGSLDAGQEGLDLREWKEKDWVMYLDLLEARGPGTMELPRYGIPHEDGMY